MTIHVSPKHRLIGVPTRPDLANIFPSARRVTIEGNDLMLINHGTETFAIRRGDRVAQLVVAPVTRGTWLEVSELDETARGEGGFGSTGGLAALKG